jgi:branched-chain amino acid transport system ATP-binding protein
MSEPEGLGATRGGAGNRALLEAEGLSVAYGAAQALFGVSLQVPAGQVLAVLGSNGAGKSSLAQALCGLVPVAAGRVAFAGADITGRPPARISRLGLAYLPEGRGIFRGLSVQDNLRMFFRTAQRDARAGNVARAYEMFPRLAERRSQVAGTLSGGEQQMLALARVLCGGARLVIADEPSLGLAPRLVDMVFEALAAARSTGTSIVHIEQYARRALAFADTAVILRRGSVAWAGPADEAGDEILGHYLGGEPGAAAERE